MPKGKTGISISGAARRLFDNVDSLPWDEIETRLEIRFDAQARREIFHCYFAYHAFLSVELDRVPLAEVKALQEAIITSVRTLLEISARFRGPNNGPIEEQNEREALFLALAFSSTAEGFDLTSSLRDIAPYCKELLRGLNEDAVQLNEVRSWPEAAALASFFVEALKGSAKQRARSNPGANQQASYFEHSRWGVPLGPRSTKTAEFASAVLGRPVSLGQVEHAFRDGRIQQSSRQ